MTVATPAAPREFAITPPGRRAYLTLLGLLSLPPVLVFLPGSESPAKDAGQSLMVILLILLGVGALLAWAMQRRTVRLAHGVLEIRAGLHRRRIASRDLDLDRSRVVNLEERLELRPRWRTNGMALPGFAAGHFRLGDASKAFLLLTERRRVLALHERNGRAVLLSITRPHELMEALRKATG